LATAIVPASLLKEVGETVISLGYRRVVFIAIQDHPLRLIVIPGNLPVLVAVLLVEALRNALLAVAVYPK
jgi:hypothetical protein